MMLDAERSLKESRNRHHRDVWLKIALPIAGGLLLLVLLTALVSVMRSAAQLAVSRDVIVTLLVLCPLAICMLPFSIGLMTLAVVSGRLHPLAKRPLRRGEALSLKMQDRVGAYADRIARWSIALSARLAPLFQWTDRLISADTTSVTSRTDGRNDDDQSPKRD